MRKINELILPVSLMVSFFASSSYIHADSSHGISLAAINLNDVGIKGVHARPSAPNEMTVATDPEANNTFSIGYSYRYADTSTSRWKLDVGISLNKVVLPSQSAVLKYQTDGVTFTYAQPPASLEYGEVYLGGLYDLSGAKSPLYVGGGLSYISGKAFKTSYQAGSPALYGKSGSSSLTGTKVSIKAGYNFESHAVELELGKNNLHVQKYRSFNIDGSDMSFNTLSIRFIKYF